MRGVWGSFVQAYVVEVIRGSHTFAQLLTTDFITLRWLVGISLIYGIGWHCKMPTLWHEIKCLNDKTMKSGFGSDTVTTNILNKWCLCWNWKNSRLRTNEGKYCTFFEASYGKGRNGSTGPVTSAAHCRKKRTWKREDEGTTLALFTLLVQIIILGMGSLYRYCTFQGVQW